jgi:hypothetical protein
MPNSINGWPVLEPTSPKLVTRTIPGTTRKIRMRDDVIPLFLAFAAEYHKTIAPIDQGTLDDWGYAYRTSRLSSAWSDHSSGTAFDLNATAEGRQGTGPLAWWKGVSRYIKATRLKAKYGILIWGGAKDLGGDYGNPANYDWMHWALKPGTNVADVSAKIKALRIQPDGTIKPLPVAPTAKPVIHVSKVQPAAKNGEVLLLQKALTDEGLYKGVLDAAFGSQTKLAYTRWQIKCGFKGADADGRPGLESLTALAKKHSFVAAK